MKILSIFLFFFFLSSIPSEKPAAKTDITVKIENISSEEGKVVVGLYTRDNFLKLPFKSTTGLIKDGKAIVTFTNVPKGEYAIVCFHDKNDNDQMDFEPTGMPKEDYGSSNNVLDMGPPQWSDAKFLVEEEPVVIEIRL